jgi:hypothetical protein
MVFFSTRGARRASMAGALFGSIGTSSPLPAWGSGRAASNKACSASDEIKPKTSGGEGDFMRQGTTEMGRAV